MQDENPLFGAKSFAEFYPPGSRSCHEHDEKTMRRGQLVFSLSTFNFWAHAARAQLANMQDAPFEAQTVADLLSACDRDTFQCALKLCLTLLDEHRA